MLPPGHFASGYLAAKALLRVVPYHFTPAQQHGLIEFGVLAGALPDVDMFYSFFKVSGITFKDDSINHRRFVSHAPIVWLVLGLVLFLVARSPYYKTMAIMLWLGAWIHFLLDSIDYGIMWLWPFSTKIYAIYNKQWTNESTSSNPIRYWWEFMKRYVQLPTFYVEVIIIIIALASAWRI